MNTPIGTLSRRAFLRGLTSVPLGLFGSTAPRASKPEPRQTGVSRFRVAGFRCYRGPELIGRMRPGEPIRLVAEPRNPHDPLAVRVEYAGEKLGYIPRRENPVVSRLLRDGARVEGRVVEVRPEEEPWRMLAVEAVLHWS